MSWSGHQLSNLLKIFCFTAMNTFFFNLCQTRTWFRLVVVVVIVVNVIPLKSLLIVIVLDTWDTGNKYLTYISFIKGSII